MLVATAGIAVIAGAPGVASFGAVFGAYYGFRAVRATVRRFVNLRRNRDPNQVRLNGRYRQAKHAFKRQRRQQRRQQRRNRARVVRRRIGRRVGTWAGRTFTASNIRFAAALATGGAAGFVLSGGNPGMAVAGAGMANGARRAIARRGEPRRSWVRTWAAKQANPPSRIDRFVAHAGYVIGGGSDGAEAAVNRLTDARADRASRNGTARTGNGAGRHSTHGQRRDPMEAHRLARQAGQRGPL